jgi:hypothetical protein
LGNPKSKTLKKTCCIKGGCKKWNLLNN